MGIEVNERMVITGDLPTTHNNKLIETLHLFNLTNVIELPFRVTDQSITLLDSILISE